MRKQLEVRKGRAFIEHGLNKTGFTVKRVWGSKVHTHKGTVINRSRFTTKYYKAIQAYA